MGWLTLRRSYLQETSFSSDGTDRAYDPVGDERAYFEDSTIIPNLESKQRSIREVSRNTTMDE